MKVLVDKSLFSNNRNLVLEEEFSYWSLEPEFFDLKLDATNNNTLNKFLEMYGFDPITFIEEKHLKLVKTLGIENPKWEYLLPKSQYQEKTKKFYQKLKEANSFFLEDKYSEKFSQGNFIINNLYRIKPDKNIIDKFLKNDNNPTLKSIVSSFNPKKDGYCEKISYNRLKTVTGRLTVDSGPQVLLLPKEMKSLFKSRHGPDGQIISIDFVSLEPRFTKLISSGESEVDIYSDILKMSNVSCTRKQMKLAVLSTLFGAGLSKLTKIVDKDAFVVKKIINDYFKIEDILKLAGDYKGGKISNYFGRPIKLKKPVSNIALNNFIQSSCVDVSLIGFSKLIKHKNMPKSINPLCVIHDALILDVRNEDLPSVKEIIKEGIFIEGLGKFYLELELHENTD